MKTMARRTNALLLALVCALAIGAAPALAAADDPPAGQEYNLDLPGSGNGSPTETSPADADSSNSGGFPVIVVVLVAGAGLAAGVAAWRMRKPSGPSESS